MHRNRPSNGIVVVAAVCAFICGCASSSKPDASSPAAIDAVVEQLMRKQQVKGMALAIIDGGTVVHVAAYGYRNVEKQLPLQTNTIMYGASLTKTAFAYMLLQLVDEARFDLDRPLAEYLPNPIPAYEDYSDLGGDNRWRTLTARHVLTHATGFANFRWLEQDRKLRFHFSPGERYAYSGEGFQLLQFVLEEGLGLNVNDEMQTRVFDRFLMPYTSMQWSEDFATNYADGYGLNGAFEPHDKRTDVSAAGSMDTTIADQARMWAGILRGEGLSESARADLVNAWLPIYSSRQFPTLLEGTDERAARIGLSAGLGLITYGRGKQKIWFKGGHNPWTGNLVVCRDVAQRCIVLLSNSLRAELIYPQLVRFLLGSTRMPWWWEYGYE